MPFHFVPNQRRRVHLTGREVRWGRLIGGHYWLVVVRGGGSHPLSGNQPAAHLRTETTHHEGYLILSHLRTKTEFTSDFTRDY